jgi:hypothetical protein
MRSSVFLSVIITIALSLALSFVAGENCFSQSGPVMKWDDDGGYDGDYSDIPRLRWVGPGSPDTYEDYLEGRVSAPLSADHVYSSPAGRPIGRATKALVLVNETLYSGIQTRLDRYVADLEDDGYTVEVYTLTGGTPENLKTFIINHSTDLAGCVFVGDFPVAWHESDVWGHEEYPCDLFFMDLDGTWSDNDLDGIYDGHSAGSGDEGPEIFIGHIDASMMSGDEVSITNEYLDKNHNYRTGGIYTPDYALSYTEDDWAMYMDMRTDIQYSYPDFDDVPAPDTNADDYVDNRVPSPDYEFIQLCCHSSDILHQFTRGGNVYNSEIKAAVPHAMFYNLFCCSTLRYTTSNFLGGSYIYDTSTTSLGVIGSAKTGSMLVFWAFYQPFGAGECFGEAFRQWFNYLAPYDNEEIGWHFGMTIAGDPFLGKTAPALFMRFPQNLPSGHQPPGAEIPIIIEVEDGSENYEPGTGFMHYRFDSADPYTPVAFTHLGGDFYEAVLPATVPGDEPEFYFVVETDLGTTISSPPDAPASVYSFDVCLAELLFKDDFEEDEGWTVENINLDIGAWERCVPNTTSGSQVAPVEDNPGGSGTYCFVTGNGPEGATFSDWDIDGGPTRLISPTIDLSLGDAQISAYNWYYSRDGNDPYQIDVSNDNGSNWTNVYSSNSSLSGWKRMAFDVSNFVTPTSEVKVRFSAQDQPNNDIVEAGLDDFTVERLNYTPSIWAEAYSLSASEGCNIDLYLDAGSGYADRSYIVAGSLSGSYPGTELPGGEVIPLNRDGMTDRILDNLNGTVFQNFSGTLDVDGKAVATLNVPGPINESHVGKTITFAFTLMGGFDFVSNPVSIDVVE